MPRKFTRSCPKGGTCLSDVIIAEFVIREGEITRASILKQLPSLKLTPRQASYRLAYLVKNGTLIKMGTGRNTCYRINRGDRKITHLMHLDKMPFELIKSGQKKVEMRLNDKKRKYIEKGDTIIFDNDDHDVVKVTVVDRKVYKSFDELYDAYEDKTVLGYLATEVASPQDMLEYYTEDKIEEYGALALTIELQ